MAFHNSSAAEKAVNHYNIHMTAGEIQSVTANINVNILIIFSVLKPFNRNSSYTSLSREKQR